MAINVSVQYDGGFLPDILLLTQCYYHRGTRLNAMKRVCLCSQPMIPPRRFDIFPSDWGILKRSRCVLCVFFPFILDINGRGVTQEEGHTGFLIHLLSAVRAFIFLARKIQPFLSLVDSEVEFCVRTI